MTAPPVLNPNNAALIELREWLQSQREAGRDVLEGESDPRKIAHTQGRLELVNELLFHTDPERRRYGS